MKTEYDSLTGGTPRDFVERLAQKLLSDKDEEPLRGSINQIMTSLQQIQCAENETLKLHGLNTLYHEIVSIRKLVQELNTWLEDILCLLLLNFAELHCAYLNSQLAYQQM